MADALNAERGEVALGDITLRLTTNGLCRAESLAGVKIPILIMNAELAGGFSVSEIRLLLFVGRVDPPAEWSLEAAGDLIDALGFSLCAVAVRMAIDAAFPEPEKPGEAKPLETNQA